MHRDVSERRFEATSYHRVEEIVIECTQLTNELENTDQLMKDRKDLFHKMWEEEQQRIMSEQQIFKEQVGHQFNHTIHQYMMNANLGEAKVMALP